MTQRYHFDASKGCMNGEKAKKRKRKEKKRKRERERERERTVGKIDHRSNK